MYTLLQDPDPDDEDPDSDDDHPLLPDSIGLGLRVALPLDGADAMINRLLFEREAPYIHNVPVDYLPGLPPAYVPPLPVWSVTKGAAPHGYDSDGYDSDDFMPYGEAEQTLLEAEYSKQANDYDRDHNFQLVAGQEPASWQVLLSGSFKPYEDAEVQSKLEEKWCRQEWATLYGIHFRCQITVRGVNYVVRRVMPTGAPAYLVQEQAADPTKTRRVQRVGGPVIVKWHTSRADRYGPERTFATQHGPNSEVHRVTRTYRVSTSASPPVVAPQPDVAPPADAAAPVADTTAQVDAPIVPPLNVDSPPASPAPKKQRIEEAVDDAANEKNSDEGPASAKGAAPLASADQTPDGHFPADHAPADNASAADEPVADKPDATEPDADVTACFHRNELGKTCFTREEASNASWRIASMRLDDRVKACLQRKKFILPQQSRSMVDGFCNESVYGTLNLICVTGLVRLDDEPDELHWETMTDEELAAIMAAKHEEDRSKRQQRDEQSKAIAASFDAWPPPEVRNDTIHAAYAQGAQLAERLPNGQYVEGHGFSWELSDNNEVNDNVGAMLGMSADHFP